MPDATATAAAPNTLQLPAAATLSFPGSVRLRYVVFAEYRRQPFRVSGALSWSHDGVSYQARMELNTPLTGTRRQTSTGRITADGLAPLRFLDEARSAQAAHFRRDTGVISFSNNAPDAPLARGAQDRLSVLLQLGAMLAGDPARYPPGSVISLQTAGTRDAETWVFGVGAAETLQLPGGALNTVKLERAPRHEFDQRVEVWLAPSMDHLPVRIRLTQPSGEVLDQQWEATDRS